MRKSEILQKDRGNLVLLAKRMTPEERLVAYANHARLMNQVYQAGVRYRAGLSPYSKRRTSRKRQARPPKQG